MAGKRHLYFGQVTWPKFPPREVKLSETVVLPESVSLLVFGKEAKTTDDWEFPPAPQTLTSLSPKCKHKPKRLDQNKQAARAERILTTAWCHAKHWHAKKTKTTITMYGKAGKDCLSIGGKCDSVKLLDTMRTMLQKLEHTRKWILSRVQSKKLSEELNWHRNQTIHFACELRGAKGDLTQIHLQSWLKNVT